MSLLHLLMVSLCFSRLVVLSVELKQYKEKENMSNGSVSLTVSDERKNFISYNLEVESNDKAQRRSNNSVYPNVVLFLVDDLGYGDLGISGHPTSRSPAIDRLASQSKIFTHFYVTSPVCSPSRASLLTGRYQVRSGIYPGALGADNPRGLPLNETTIAEILKKKGYRTLIVGKWHLGVGYEGEYLPAHHGFDDYLGVPYSHDMCPCYACFPDKPCEGGCSTSHVSCPLFSNTTIIEQPMQLQSLTGKLVDKAKQFLKDSAQDDAPFFLYMPFMHVHHPQFSSEEFSGKSARGIFGDALLELDHSIDTILQTLDTFDLADNTVVWFLSDNGPSLRRHEGGGCAGALRCGKGTAWEGGVRVPAFVRWPGHIGPSRTGELLSSLEVLPTIAALTGADTSGLKLDGFDASDFLLDKTSESPREYFAVYPMDPSQETGPHAVVYRHLKAHFFTIGDLLSDDQNYDEICTSRHLLTEHNPPLLYDLSVDPGERWNVANDTSFKISLIEMTAWRQAHMVDMTWMPSVTNDHDKYSEPCCTDHYCEPFPSCCDCPLK
ncbi:arylsulfatase A-like [Hyalella azteca]|uniref:Arylsulfatase A-like n=1 Tax=Hyalella azteca TaxID=294128 RepID=A0A979FFS5_HYAAZ|nr:arylsulfatase A-like [Hyalella azteca]